MRPSPIRSQPRDRPLPPPAVVMGVGRKIASDLPPHHPSVLAGDRHREAVRDRNREALRRFEQQINQQQRDRWH